MKPEEFDKQFFAWLDAQTKSTVEHFDEWQKKLKALVDDLRAKKYDEVIREGDAIRDLYPDYVEAGSVYEFMADAYLAKGDKADGAKELEQYSQVGGRSPAADRSAWPRCEEEAGEPRKRPPRSIV